MTEKEKLIENIIKNAAPKKSVKEVEPSEEDNLIAIMGALAFEVRSFKNELKNMKKDEFKGQMKEVGNGLYSREIYINE